MITLKLTLDTRKIRDDGRFPLLYRISYLGKSRDISLKIYLHLNEWDSKSQLIKDKIQRELYQPIIEHMKIQILTKSHEYLLNSKAIASIQGLKDFISGNSKQEWTFKQFWEDEISRFKQSKRYGNASIHESSLKLLNELKSLNIPIKNVDYSYLNFVQRKLLERDCKINTVSVYLRCLRKVWIIAVKEKLVSAEFYPFNDFKIKSERVSPRAITIAEMKKIFALKVQNNSALIDTLNYAKIIFCLRGINFKDLALLTKENYINGRITFKRAKTGKLYSIKATKVVVEILNFYSSNERKTLLPILNNDELNSGASLHATIKQRTKTCNKYLDRIGKTAKLEIKLTTYVFRYSYANIARGLGFSKDLIAEALGHEYGNSVTGIYLNDFDEEKVDEMNSIIVNAVTLV